MNQYNYRKLHGYTSTTARELTTSIAYRFCKREVRANGAALAHRFVAHDPSNLAISIARAGENDCASTGNNDCAHTSMKANDLS